MNSRMISAFFALLSLVGLGAILLSVAAKGQAQFGQPAPYLIKDINPTGDAYPNTFITLNDQLYFFANNGQNRTLWVSNGLSDDTRMVNDIYPDGDGTGPGIYPRIVEVIGNTIYFSVSEGGDSHNELWKSDGTEAGTELVKRFDGQSIERMAHLGTVLYLVMYRGSNAAVSLWRSDGTSTGTQEVLGTFSRIRVLFEFEGKLYLDVGGASSGETKNIWTVSGDTMVPAFFVDRLEDTIVYQDAIYYSTQSTLWKSDGTGENREKILDFNQIGYNITSMTVHQGTLYFSVGFANLWKSDGTPAGTMQIASYPYAINAFLSHNGLLYFTTSDHSGTNRIGITDGNITGTVPFPPATTFDSASQLTAFDGFVYFFGGERNRVELWRTDNTESGTKRILDITSDIGETNFYQCPCMAVAGDRLFVTAQTATGVELWAVPAEQTSTPTPTKTPTSAPTSTATATATATPVQVQTVTATPTLVPTRIPEQTATPISHISEEIFLPLIANQ
ncbi:MAG TPA: hypothetical protein P5121_25555 [Caldilineaceae bacterium]|nr:hypothetical protein [Caldilineaceae bacterium]